MKAAEALDTGEGNKVPNASREKHGDKRKYDTIWSVQRGDQPWGNDDQREFNRRKALKTYGVFFERYEMLLEMVKNLDSKLSKLCPHKRPTLNWTQLVGDQRQFHQFCSSDNTIGVISNPVKWRKISLIDLLSDTSVAKLWTQEEKKRVTHLMRRWFINLRQRKNKLDTWILRLLRCSVTSEYGIEVLL